MDALQFVIDGVAFMALAFVGGIILSLLTIGICTLVEIAINVYSTDKKYLFLLLAILGSLALGCFFI